MRKIFLGVAAGLLLLGVGFAQAAKPSRTVSYFLTKGDAISGEVLSALAAEPNCAGIEVNFYRDPSFAVETDHTVWQLKAVTAAARRANNLQKYRYSYIVSPPGAESAEDLVAIVSGGTPKVIALRVCAQVNGLPGARIHAVPQ